MADTERLSRITELTADSRSKLVLAGDSAQLSPIGAGGLFEQLRERVPTAELTEVHRANHDWERQAWEQVRNGEPGPALAAYQAHDRLHVHDTRAEAAEAMVDDWDKTRREPARRQGGDDHRRLQRRARPDQRDGPGASRCRRRARLTRS